MTQPIGDRNIPGLRVRDLVTILGCTLTILWAVATAYFNTMRRLDKIEDTRYLELRLHTLETSTQAVQSKIQAIEADININRRFLKQLSNDDNK